MQSKNRNGKSGSPWRMPLVGVIILLGSPFTSMEYVTVLTHSIMRLIQCSVNPIFSMIEDK